MKYFWMSMNNGGPTSLVADTTDFMGIDDGELCKGRSIEGWSPAATASVSSRGQSGVADDVLQVASSAPVFSERLCNTLQHASIAKIQFLPVTVSDGSQLAQRYFVANILDRIDALDVGASMLSRFPADYFMEARRGLISGLRIPVLRADRLGEQNHMFRLQEFWPPVFVSERFRHLYLLGRFSGAKFLEVQVTGRSMDEEP